MRILYTLLLYLAVPLVLGRLYWRGRRAPDYRRRWRERFGWVGPIEGPSIWVHAVSVGEVRAALPLIRALAERHPGLPVVVTTTTPTGSRQVRDALGGVVHHCYAPYDLPGAVARYLARARPAVAVIMETELWPNLFHACARRDIPVLVVNARLSQRSMRGYLRVRRLAAQTLRRVHLVAAQSAADGERFRRLGAPRVEVAGNIKYDLAPPAGLVEHGRELRQALAPRRPVWIAASTHRGEEEQVLDAHTALLARHPALLLVLVPRHPERFGEVFERCQARGLATMRRSAGVACPPGTAVYLGDTMGELLLLYAAADAAFVGGSLVPTGGHNVLEPALLGLPVLFGPHMFNFVEAASRMLDAGAAWQVEDARALAGELARLLEAPGQAREAGERGRAMVEAHRGALARLLESVAAALPPER